MCGSSDIFICGSQIMWECSDIFCNFSYTHGWIILYIEPKKYDLKEVEAILTGLTKLEKKYLLVRNLSGAWSSPS